MRSGRRLRPLSAHGKGDHRGSGPGQRRRGVLITGRRCRAGSNIDAGPVMAFMTGNLSYQIEHHLYRICRAPAGRDLGAGAPGVR